MWMKETRTVDKGGNDCGFAAADLPQAKIINTADNKVVTDK